MAIAVTTVASGGLPVTDVTATHTMLGLHVVETTKGLAVTKGPGGLPVNFAPVADWPSGGGGGGGGTTPATWDLATAIAVTLSGGNLTATNTGTTSANQGARVADLGGKTSGKYYFEITPTVANAGNNYGFGVGTTGSTYTGIGGGGTIGVVCYRSSGNIWANGISSGSSISTWSVATPIGIAVDLDNRKIWFHKSPSNTWNSGTPVGNDPAANVGGVTIPAGTMVPFVTYGGGLGVAGSASTANFGATTFTGAVPAGFTSGWPV